jgi:hypothetical protein
LHAIPEIVVGNIEAARQHSPPISNNELLMVPEQIAWTPTRVEPPDSSAGLTEGCEETVGREGRSESINHYLDANATLRALDQFGEDRMTALVIAKNVNHERDSLGCTSNERRKLPAYPRAVFQ